MSEAKLTLVKERKEEAEGEEGKGEEVEEESTFVLFHKPIDSVLYFFLTLNVMFAKRKRERERITVESHATSVSSVACSSLLFFFLSTMKSRNNVSLLLTQLYFEHCEAKHSQEDSHRLTQTEWHLQ